MDLFNIATPKRVYQTVTDNLNELPEKLSAQGAENWVAKGVLRHRKEGYLCLHKTDLGAVAFNIPTKGSIEAMKTWKKKFESGDWEMEGILFAEQVKIGSGLGAEMLLSGYQGFF